MFAARRMYTHCFHLPYARREYWVSNVIVELDGALKELGIEKFLRIISPLAPNILRKIKTFCLTG